MVRGLFACFEGVDHSGKTTHARALVHNLHARGIRALYVRFPDRTTPIGCQLDQYLKKIKDHDHSLRQLHNLFAANRWERAREIMDALSKGITVVADRYTYSGIAYSAAQGLDRESCIAQDIGLPEPDIVFYVSAPFSEVIARIARESQPEIYENAEMIARVAREYDAIARECMDCGHPRWVSVHTRANADDVARDVLASALEMAHTCEARDIHFILRADSAGKRMS